MKNNMRHFISQNEVKRADIELESANERKIRELKAELKKLFKSKYRRFNVLLLNECFEKLDLTAKKQGTSKAKMLGIMISQFN